MPMMFPSMLNRKFSGMFGCQFYLCYNDTPWEKNAGVFAAA